MKSAVARLQAMATCLSVEMRNSALTSTSWGKRGQGVGEEDQDVDLVRGDHCPELLVTAQRSAPEQIDGKACRLADL